MSWRILQGDCIEQMKTLDEKSVQTCVTSPPYFGLRDYGTASWIGGDESCDHRANRANRANRPKGKLVGSTATVDAGEPAVMICPKCGATREDQQIGLEPTPDEFVEAIVAVFREVRRVLRDDGTVWLNLGDSYASDSKGSGGPSVKQLRNAGSRYESRKLNHGVKQKDLIGIPWMVAFALRADGWYLRQDIIWAKPNPMPESVQDRCTKAHEYIFLLTKSPRYYYDADAIAEPAKWERWGDQTEKKQHTGTAGHLGGKSLAELPIKDTKNKRSVWTVSTKPYSGAHFATFPPDLIEPCILAGSAEGDTVLDPFTGSGTTGMVALRHNRSFVGCELNPEYVEIARNRIVDDAPLMNQLSEAA